MSASSQDFLRRVVVAALGVRLTAIAVAMLAFVGQTMTLHVLVSVVALSASSLLCLFRPAVLEYVVRHPLAIVLDTLVVLAVIGVMGVDSPFVLAGFSSALLVGLLFPLRVSLPATVVLVAGYLLAAAATPVPDRGFMVTLGVPLIFVSLVSIGTTVRGAHEQQVRTARAVAAARDDAAAAEERARLAREMHDSLGKTLYGIALAAHALPGWVEREPEVAVVQAKNLALGAEQAAEEARRILVRMRTDQPDRPLVEVLAEQCERWSVEHGVPCWFTATGVADIPAGHRYEVLAIVSEALENIARHADAAKVDVELTGRADGSIDVTVHDDGRGFRPRQDGQSPRGHFGLTGMKERAEQIGGSLTVASVPGRGTSITVHRPGEESTG